MQFIACCRTLLYKSRVSSKTLLAMKLTTILLLAACLNVTANGYGQKVSLSTKQGYLEQVFGEIKKQTGYTFVYTDALLQKAKRVNINAKDAAL